MYNEMKPVYLFLFLLIISQVFINYTFTMYKTVHNATRHDWVFILGTGRSGTTSILHMVNKLSNEVYLQGEPNQLIQNLRKLNDSIFSIPRNSSGAYYAEEFDPQRLYTSFRHVVKHEIGNMGDKRVVGFKEVTILRPMDLNFLYRLFPNAKFIINWRYDLDAQFKSRMKIHMKKPKTVNGLRQITEQLTNWSKTIPTRQVFLLPLEEFSLGRFNQMVEFLGFTGCSYNYILRNNYQQSLEYDARQDAVQGKCLYK